MIEEIQNKIQQVLSFSTNNIDELEKLQEAARKVIDKGLREDPKGLQFEAVGLEKAIAKANA